jgi:hypothetical protein
LTERSSQGVSEIKIPSGTSESSSKYRKENGIEVEGENIVPPVIMTPNLINEPEFPPRLKDNFLTI